MTFLPVVDRELRVAARKRSTFWLRVAAALVAMLIGSAFLLISKATGITLSGLGQGLFGTITWLALATALSVGLFFTSDCLSEEKREGTIGFLFLTDLRGYDVVGGKLLATSLRCVYGLLAVMPILAITLIMGGVTGAQLGKTSLALLNALICSLAAGMFISAISRDPQKAMAGTFGFLLLWLFGGMLADWILVKIGQYRFVAPWSYSSPFYAFRNANAWGKSRFWEALGVSQGLAWVLLALASLALPRTWQERSRSRSSSVSSTWSYAWRYGGVGRRTRLRQRLLERNPALWLVCRERWQSLGIWALAIIMASAFLIMVLMDLPPTVWAVWHWMGRVFIVALYLWMASQAGRFFVEARRSGLVELLLASPLSVRQIIRGQWRALLRLFGPPIAVMLALDVAAALFSEGVWTAVSRSVPFGSALTRMITEILQDVGGALMTVANLAAMTWFGMWMGMTSKNNNLATLKTLLLAQVIPLGVIWLAAVLISAFGSMWFSSVFAGASASAVMAWYPLIPIASVFVLHLAKDAVFFYFSRMALYSKFRERAIREMTPTRVAVSPPPMPRAVIAPPVVAAVSK